VSISVVVLTYNSARTIESCLESLAAQRRPPAEVIVVDDDSTDDTLAIVAKVADRTGLPVRVVRNGSHNISRGRNLGIDAATTRLVAFLDSDARAEPTWTRALVAAFGAGPDVAVVGGAVVAAHTTRFAEAISVNDSTVRALATSGALLIGGCNMAVDVGRLRGERFDVRWRHAEDIEFTNRVSRHAGWAVAPAAEVWHESRARMAGYFSQMYRYGLWKVRYTLRTGHLRPIDLVPSAVLVTSVLAAIVLSPIALLGFPGLCVAESLFVIAYRRPPVRLVPGIFAGWLVKNAGWGLGVLAALALAAVGRPGPRGPAPDGR
jgi:glycosyltransferase involved in cell wall biosynthesis